MIRNSIKIFDTFAEAFPMKCSRLIVTAETEKWARIAANSFTGFATSVIACGCESAIEKTLSKKETPDQRPGISILIFSMSSICEDYAYQIDGVGGGNFLILADSKLNALKASEVAVREMQKIPNTILPFPGGVVRSGSQVGSKYKSLLASTNFEYCPTIKGVVKTALI